MLLILLSIFYSQKFTILFSHGNSTDIGRMLGNLLEMSYNLKSDVLAYEYSGYGEAQGNPSEENLIHDIQHTYDFLTLDLQIAWQKIIVYGQSLGSGPSTFLSSDRGSPVGGLVLHAAFASGLRIIDINLKHNNKFDLFPNVHMLQYVNCPVFILHGEDDKEVPISNGYMLYQATNNPYKPWFMKAAHNDIEIIHKKQYFIELNLFLQHVRQQ